MHYTAKKNVEVQFLGNRVECGYKTYRRLEVSFMLRVVVPPDNKSRTHMS